MTTLAHTRNVLAHTTPRKTQRRTLLVPLATIAVIVSMVSWFAYGQADGTMTMLDSFPSGNRSSAADIEMLRILSAAFAPSIVGLLLALFGRGLQEDGKQ